MHSFITIKSNAQMEQVYSAICGKLLMQKSLNRGGAHAQREDTTSSNALELLHVILEFEIDKELAAWQVTVQPNLPWAEDHFNERISGEPVNPPPSEQWWPFAQAGNAVHKKNQVFSHTYPERFWPKRAASQGFVTDQAPPLSDRYGIRFPYGDLDDLVGVLIKNPASRQAYLPVWFPEDGGASLQGERVPCTLGYHFLQRADGKLDCTYFLRSCDVVRFLRDDVYMAGRLGQYVGFRTGMAPGNLTVHIANLHAFEGDRHFLASKGSNTYKIDQRSTYDFGALG